MILFATSTVQLDFNMSIKLFILFILFETIRGYELKQVIMLSRHNIRIPWSSGIECLSPKKWPVWYGDPGDLTPKGSLLERYFGKYFFDWMLEQHLFDNNCPVSEVFVYANNQQRTVESAKSFVKGAFGNCVSVYYKNNPEADPIFATIIRNTSLELREAVLNEMQKDIDEVDLKNAFLELDRILDIRNSSNCKINMMCALGEEKNEIVYKLFEEPDISGSLKYGWMVVDSFLMAYYDGMTRENVAWGQIHTTQQWKNLMEILKAYHESRCESKILDKELASPLIHYLTDIFQNGTRKLYLLVGHDKNITPLMSSLKFKDYILNDQIEKTPIGGKLVFQKWHDKENDKDLLRVDYVYQSTKQIRDGAELSLQNPPHWQILEMESCAVDKNGFCPWNNFINILNNV